MAQTAQVDIEEVLPIVKDITEHMSAMETTIKKITDNALAVSEDTNLKSMEAVYQAFQTMSDQSTNMTSAMDECVVATEKYVAEVAAIDEEDQSLYD